MASLGLLYSPGPVKNKGIGSFQGNLKKNERKKRKPINVWKNKGVNGGGRGIRKSNGGEYAHNTLGNCMMLTN